MATAVKPVIRKHEGTAYTVDVGGYTATVKLGLEMGGVSPLNAEVVKDGRREAEIEGVLRGGGKIAAFERIHASEGVPKGEGLVAIGALIVSVEEALRQGGVERVRIRTHPAFARMLTGQMGYSEVPPVTPTTLDVEKDITRNVPQLPRVWDIRKGK